MAVLTSAAVRGPSQNGALLGPAAWQIRSDGMLECEMLRLPAAQDIALDVGCKKREADQLAHVRRWWRSLDDRHGGIVPVQHRAGLAQRADHGGVAARAALVVLAMVGR